MSDTIAEYDVLASLGAFEANGYGGRELLCPYCGQREFAYVHWQAPAIHETDGYTAPTGERGSWLDVPLWCELGGHHFHLVIAFHKGCTYVHIVPGESEPSVTAPLPAAIKYPDDRVEE